MFEYMRAKILKVPVYINFVSNAVLSYYIYGASLQKQWNMKAFTDNFL